MKAEILRNHLPETEKSYYEKNNPGWKVKTRDCLLVTFDDGASITYIIFEGAWTQDDMCRDCGTYYELAIGNKIVKIPHSKC